MPYDPTNPLAARAAEILRDNDTGALVKAAPSLYPHQWSWDAALVSIGLGHIDLDRAIAELRHLFRGQWRNGLIPHIQYDANATAAAYFPDAERWASRYVSPDAPQDVATSGIVQPPVHAFAVRQLIGLASLEQGTEIAREFFRPLMNWHRYLHSARDPENSGLITIVHPWESGMDNSPRWDSAMARIEVPKDDLPPYTRRDLAHVSDPSQRPTNEDYDRYIWILEVLKRSRYRVDVGYDQLPFRVKDVFFTALLVAGNESLMHIASIAGADLEDMDIIEEWIALGRRGLTARWDDATGRCLDYDVVSDTEIDVDTIASISPIFAGQVSRGVRQAIIDRWQSSALTGHPDLRWKLPPSTSLDAPQFNTTRYWRGPVWPVINWLTWHAWQRNGEFALADELREQALAQIAASGFYEYMNPVTGEGMGSDAQSWTAAAVLDWLAE
ncbi:MAG: hypothetical protein M9950_05810 [Thermomicrobiales bacterium]|nr:hypothetical protein [Thermomicrobiales bacterium]